MEQRDYLLREIEKIGKMIAAIRQKIFGEQGNLSVTIGKQSEDLKGMLLDQANLDLDKLVGLSVRETDEYLDSLEGFTIENIELLAETLTEIGLQSASIDFLCSALALFEICNLRDRTFSINREANIGVLKDAILQIRQ